MQRQIGMVAILTAVTLATGVPVESVNAAAKFSKDEAVVANKLETTYGVEVLRIRSGVIDGMAVYIVTVMNPAGNFNGAFRVTTLAVDKDSGRLVSQYRQTATGPRHSASERREISSDNSGVEIRRRTESRLRER